SPQLPQSSHASTFSSIYHHLFSTSILFFFNDTATTEIYTLSLHDALPIYGDDHDAAARDERHRRGAGPEGEGRLAARRDDLRLRSEEHTSELQSLTNLVCRLLLEKKKKKDNKSDMCKR